MIKSIYNSIKEFFTREKLINDIQILTETNTELNKRLDNHIHSLHKQGKAITEIEDTILDIYHEIQIAIAILRGINPSDIQKFTDMYQLRKYLDALNKQMKNRSENSNKT